MNTKTMTNQYEHLDLWPTHDFVSAVIDSQMTAVTCLKDSQDKIAWAIEEATKRLRTSAGRLIYVGAGTSGRLAVQDGLELNPTFGWPEDRVCYVIAGGKEAMVSALEGDEDDAEQAERDITAIKISNDDVVIVITASGCTPYSIAAAMKAKTSGALIIGISNNSNTNLSAECSIAIELITGKEVIAGSTRMAAGTAQKAVLNTISTGIMVGLKRVFSNLMIDLNSNNAKLDKRSTDIVSTISHSSKEAAAAALSAAKGNIRLAVLLSHGLNINDAQDLLGKHKFDLRACLTELTIKQIRRTS